MTSKQLDGRNWATRRQVELAQQVAKDGRWDEAIQVNRQILETFPKDVEALNRLGKALFELGQLEESLETYAQAFEIDPTNAIARRNTLRIEQLIAARGEQSEHGLPNKPTYQFDPNVYVEEVGRTYITDLQRPAPEATLLLVSPGDPLDLRIEGGQVVVFDLSGNRLGQTEPRIAQRVERLIGVGNRYAAFVVGLTGNTVRIILREVYRNPETPADLVFPRQATIAAPRPYLRDTQRLARELESELLLDLDEDEDEDDDEDEEGVGEEIDEADNVDDDSDEEEFVVSEDADEEETPRVEE